MTSDIFLYVATLTSLFFTNAQQFFSGHNFGYPAPRIPLGYQPPPQPPLLYDYPSQTQTTQNQRQQFNGHFQPPQLHPPGSAPNQPRQQTQYPVNFNPTSIPNQRPEYFSSQYPSQSEYLTQTSQYPVQQLQNGQHQTTNLPILPPTVITEPTKPPIIINTLIQVFMDGKNKTIGNKTMASTAVIHRNDKIILTREFDTKTLTFVEENGNEKHDQENLITVKGTAATESKEISQDDLAKELEKELTNSIPVILEELDKLKKAKMSKDQMMKENQTMKNGKVVAPSEKPDDDVNIEDLEKLIKEGLDELEDNEAKKELEKEFNEVIQNTSSVPSTQGTTSSSFASHELAETTTLPLGIVTYVVDLEPISTKKEVISPEAGFTTSSMLEHSEIKTTIKPLMSESKEKTDSSLISTQSQTPEPTEMMVPEKAMVATSIEENLDETTTPEVEQTFPTETTTKAAVKQTPEPVEMIMPIKSMVVKSEEDFEETTHVPVTAEMVIPEKAMIGKSIEETEATTLETTTVPVETTEVVVTTAASSTTEEPTTAEPTTLTSTLPETTPTETTEVTTESSVTTTELPETTTILVTTEAAPITTTELPELSTTEAALTTTEIAETSTLTEAEPTTTAQISTEKTTLESSTTEITEGQQSTSVSDKTETEIGTTATPLLTSFETTPETVKSTITLPILPEQQCETPNDESDTTKGDVLFLLDSSSSVGPEQFKKAVRLISQTVLNFNNIGPTGIQVSLVQYNREPFLEFSFRRHNCLSSLLDDINDTEFMNGVSNLGRALEKVMKYAFTQARGDRLDAENILVLVTDGLSDDEIQHPITLNRKNGTTPIAVATLQAKKDILMGLVEDDHDNVFNLTEAVKKPIGERLATRIIEILKSKTKTNVEPIKSLEIATTTPFLEQNSDNTPLQVNPSIIEMEVTAMPIVPTNDGSVIVECKNNGLKVTMMIPENYAGAIVAKDFSDNPECFTEINQIDGNSEKMRSVVVEIAQGKCGLKTIESTKAVGHQNSIILNLLHKKEIITAQDKSFIIECFQPSGVTNTTLQTILNIESDLPQNKTYSLTIAPPKCYYTLRKDSLNGPVVQNARIGQIIYHRWECAGDNLTNSVYGLYVHDCKAQNSTKQDFIIINDQGCSTDSTIVNNIVYAEETLLAFAKSYVFTLTDVTSLLFSCKVSLCVRDGDGCEGYSPPVCPSSNMSDVLLTRRVRHYDDALQAALTSELQAKIEDVTDSLTVVKIKELHFPIWVIISAAVIIGSFLGLIWHMCSNTRSRKMMSINGSSQSNFPDDDSTTDKSETLSFRSLDYRTGDEHSVDLHGITTSAPTSPVLSHA